MQALSALPKQHRSPAGRPAIPSLEVRAGQCFPAPGHRFCKARQPTSAPAFGSPFPGVQIGQFAQVLQYGRPIGVVQMTPQGWAGAPQLLSIFHQQHCNLARAEVSQRQAGLVPQGMSQNIPAGLSNPGSRISSAANGRRQKLADGPIECTDLAQAGTFGPSSHSACGGKRQKLAEDARPEIKTPGWRSEDIELLDDDAASDFESPQQPDESARAENQHEGEEIEAQDTRDQGIAVEQQTSSVQENGESLKATQSSQAEDSQNLRREGFSEKSGTACPEYLEVLPLTHSQQTSAYDAWRSHVCQAYSQGLSSPAGERPSFGEATPAAVAVSSIMRTCLTRFCPASIRHRSLNLPILST